MFCPLAQGGAIDASRYNDNGQRYIVYKVVCNLDTSALPQLTPIWDGNSIRNGGVCHNTSEHPTPDGEA